MRTLLLLAALIVPHIVAQDVVFIGRRNETWGKSGPQSQIQLYSTTGAGSLDLAPNADIYGPSDSGGQILAFQKNGKDAPILHKIATDWGATDMAYAQATETLYFGQPTGSLKGSVYYFN